MVKTRLPMQETEVLSPGQEDSLKEEMSTLSSILDGETPWTEEHGRLLSMGSQRVRHDLVTKEQNNNIVVLGCFFKSASSSRKFIGKTFD